MISDAEYTEADRQQMNRLYLEMRREDRKSMWRKIGLFIVAMIFAVCMWPWVCGFAELARVWIERSGR